MAGNSNSEHRTQHFGPGYSYLTHNYQRQIGIMNGNIQERAASYHQGPR
jgi:hypothetical protein